MRGQEDLVEELSNNLSEVPFKMKTPGENTKGMDDKELQRLPSKIMRAEANAGTGAGEAAQ